MTCTDAVWKATAASQLLRLLETILQLGVCPAQLVLSLRRHGRRWLVHWRCLMRMHSYCDMLHHQHFR